MSKLEQLVERLCPNGVEHKKLSEIATVARGVRVVREQLKSEGKIPVFQNSLKPLGYHNKSNISANTAFVIGAGAAGEIGYSTVDFWAADDCYYFVCPRELDNRYLYYVLMKNQPLLLSRVRKASIPRLSRSVIENLIIPLPPLEIQKEVVRILDNFTELTAELETKLTAELTARKKQYEYYRDLMLAFAVHGRTSECEWMALGEVADLLSGFPFDSKKFASNGIRLMRGMNIKRGYLDFSEGNNRYWASAVGLEKYELLNDDIVIAMDGSLVGKSFGLISENQLPLLLVQRVARIRARKNYNNRYIYYCITSAFSSYVDSQKTEGAVPHISLKDISNFKIPVPPLEEQTRIVNIIDRFDKLCNNISEGLPAEIEARRKQYEYYRDKLLTFKAR